MKIVYFKEGNMGMTKKKKIIVLVTMCLLLVVTGYLNFALAKKDGVQDVASSEITSYGNFFDTYRADRQSTRNQEIDYLDAIIASSDSLESHKEAATTQKMNLVARMETELVLEGLIRAKGYEDVIVTTSADNYNILIKCEDNLTSEEVAQILGIVTQQTSANATNIKIIPIN